MYEKMGQNFLKQKQQKIYIYKKYFILNLKYIQ